LGRLLVLFMLANLLARFSMSIQIDGAFIFTSTHCVFLLG